MRGSYFFADGPLQRQLRRKKTSSVVRRFTTGYCLVTNGRLAIATNCRRSYRWFARPDQFAQFGYATLAASDFSANKICRASVSRSLF
jgi:hypothetical protein